MKTKKQYYSIINIPDNVTVNKINNILYFKGPLGVSVLDLKKIDPKGLAGIFIESCTHFITKDLNILQNKKLNQNRIKITTTSKAFFGLFKSILQNKLQGVSRGFLMYLKIIGIGYRASLTQNNQTLFLKLGYSHDVIYKIPSSIRIFLVDPTLICLFGVDKNQITQVAAQIRKLRSPTVYKGKGIRFLNEKVLLKVGKRK
jgi:large subunit ribosomal protein L6